MPEFSFGSKEEFATALYDACDLIVNAYLKTDALDSYESEGCTPYLFHKFAQNVMNQIANGNFHPSDS